MKFADKLKQYALTTLGNIREEGGAELSRLGTQGCMELASALFNGHGFVLYGPGQWAPEVGKQEPNMPAPEVGKQEPGIEPEQGQEQGREM